MQKRDSGCFMHPPLTDGIKKGDCLLCVKKQAID